jgi:hypothetical protein
MEGARRHVHRAHLTTLALEVAPRTRTRLRVADGAADGGGEARAGFLLKVAVIRDAPPPERMHVRVTRRHASDDEVAPDLGKQVR